MRLSPFTNHKSDHTEGLLTRTIENQTAKLPSDLFLWAALGSIGAAVGLFASGRRTSGNFVGMWAPVFLNLGIYNKLVKTGGHSRHR